MLWYCLDAFFIVPKMYSFSAEIESRGYHVYRDTNWNNARVNQPVVVCQESSAISKAYDPYSCKITITRPDRVGAVTVGHIPREISRYVHYFLHEGGSVTGIVTDVHHRLSPIPEGGLEIPIHMAFSIRSKAILKK